MILLVLENKLHLTNPADLARAEECISKQNAVELFETGHLDELNPGTVEALAEIHRCLFPKFMPLLAKSGRSIWQRAISALLLCYTLKQL